MIWSACAYLDWMGLHWNMEPSLGMPCMVQLGQLGPGLACKGSLIKKKIKFSSYIRKFRMEQFQSNIWLTAYSYSIWGNICAFPHILGGLSSYMTVQLLHSEFPYIWGNLIFFFYQCTRLAQILFCFRFRRNKGDHSYSTLHSVSLPVRIYAEGYEFTWV